MSGAEVAVSSRPDNVPGSTEESSCSSQIQSVRGIDSSPRRTASPNPVPEGAYVMRSAPNESRNRSALPSVELTSTTRHVVGA